MTKKEYSAPVVKTEKVVLGVFGCYPTGGSGGSGGSGGNSGFGGRGGGRGFKPPWKKGWRF